ncbi:MAG: UDP-N-acetylglucosamine 2-epimerase (non-hydrolyzing) [Chlamydiales bacterium]
MRILSVFGTRPETIKMAPVVSRLKEVRGIESFVCVTGQHRQMLDPFMSLFQIKADYDLNIMRPGQSLTEITTSVLTGLKKVLIEVKPDLLLVQGDTTTAFAGALAAFYEKIRVGHVEAGLRTGNLRMPWPEEMNRKLITSIAETHFAPTNGSRANLVKEGVREGAIFVTGNTVIDALFYTLDQFKKKPELKTNRFDFLDPKRRLILVTGHRRENFGEGIAAICRSLHRLSKRDDVQIVYPVHLNPNVQEPVRSILGTRDNIHLIEPLDYLDFVFLMDLAYLILSDSGGVQEEAPSLGKPVLVTREVTERPEAVEAGTVILVGTDEEKIVRETEKLLDDPACYLKMAQAHNPYGDGHAALRIVQEIVNDETSV